MSPSYLGLASTKNRAVITVCQRRN
jgi:hypothetical protein